MITSLFIAGYRCLRKVQFPRLSRLHAFIGPNDSGKTTILDAVSTLSGLLSPDANALEAPRKVLSETIAANAKAGLKRDPEFILEVKLDERVSFRVDDLLNPGKGVVKVNPAVTQPSLDAELGSWGGAHVSQVAKARELFWPAPILRLNPTILRAPSPLIPTDAQSPLLLLQRDLAGTRPGEGGHPTFQGGIAGLLDLVLNRGDGAFLEIVGETQQLFPTISGLRLRNLTGVKTLEATLSSGENVPAAHLSDGLLYYLGFAAMRFLSPIPIVMIEEPENGLHPSRIRDVVRVLRKVSESSHVLLTTHSPLVVNELEPPEVTVVTRDHEGTHVTPITKTPSFEERSKVYALGELWLSYANGKDEEPLMGKASG